MGSSKTRLKPVIYDDEEVRFDEAFWRDSHQYIMDIGGLPEICKEFFDDDGNIVERISIEKNGRVTIQRFYPDPQELKETWHGSLVFFPDSCIVGGLTIRGKRYISERTLKPFILRTARAATKERRKEMTRPRL